MKMNRRNMLIGIGAATAGSGAVLGSGAFTQVNADRTANFTVVGDNSAYLDLSGTGAAMLAQKPAVKVRASSNSMPLT